MNKMWIMIAGVVGLVFIVKAIAGGSKGDVMAAKEKIKQGALVLDVRTPGEYQGGHLSGALNIPLQNLEERMGELKDKNKAMVVYCASGMRSAQAARILSAAGFTDVTNAGGLGNLK